jgi:HlyD family secretion protein
MSTAQATVAAHAKRKSLTEVIDEESHRHRMRVLSIWAAVAVLAVLAAASFYALRPKPLPMAARFRTQAVTQGPLVREVHATGHVEALTTVQVGAEISGRIASVEVDYNQQVRAGQVLARFDRAALQAQVAQMNASLLAAKTGLEQSKAELEQAFRVRDRARQLHEHGSATDADLDLAESNARVAEQRVQASDAQVSAQSAALALAMTNLTHTEIRSPIDGMVITRNIDPGQSVASVLQAPTLFTVAADLRLIRVVAAVDEADIGDVQDRQPAVFTVNAYPERQFDGRVVEVRNSPVVVQDVITYGTVVEAENLDLALRPGMTASVRIRTAALPSTVSVPNAALHFTPPHQVAVPQPGVWVIDGETLRRIPVHPGISDGESTAVDRTDLPLQAAVIVDLTPAGRKAYDIGS